MSGKVWVKGHYRSKPTPPPTEEKNGGIGCFGVIMIGFFVLGVAAGGGGGSSSTEEEKPKPPITRKYSISVAVSYRNRDGNEWDLNGAPDPYICITDEKSTQCVGLSDGGGKGDPLCRDAFTCIYEDIELIGEKFDVRVLDKDVFSDDLIASGTCSQSAEVCDLKWARVGLRKR